jgi:hypothetical protein
MSRLWQVLRNRAGEDDPRAVERDMGRLHVAQAQRRVRPIGVEQRPQAAVGISEAWPSAVFSAPPRYFPALGSQIDTNSSRSRSRSRLRWSRANRLRFVP